MGCPAKKLSLGAFSCFVIAGLFFACQQKSWDRTVKTKAVTPFKISVSHGGGFTGMTSGYTLYQDGKVEHWQRFRTGADSVLWSKQVEDRKIQRFADTLKKSGFLQRTVRESGNMTTVVSFQLPDTTYTWYWSGGKYPELQTWLQEVETFCAGLERKE